MAVAAAGGGERVEKQQQHAMARVQVLVVGGRLVIGSPMISPKYRLLLEPSGFLPDAPCVRSDRNSVNMKGNSILLNSGFLFIPLLCHCSRISESNIRLRDADCATTHLPSSFFSISDTPGPTNNSNLSFSTAELANILQTLPNSADLGGDLRV